MTMTLGQVVSLVGGILAIVATLAAGFVSYGRLQTLVETQAQTNSRQSRAIERLTEDLGGLQAFLLDVMAIRGVSTPLDPDQYFEQPNEE